MSHMNSLRKERETFALTKGTSVCDSNTRNMSRWRIIASTYNKRLPWQKHSRLTQKTFTAHTENIHGSHRNIHGSHRKHPRLTQKHSRLTQKHSRLTQKTFTAHTETFTAHTENTIGFLEALLRLEWDYFSCINKIWKLYNIKQLFIFKCL